MAHGLRSWLPQEALMDGRLSDLLGGAIGRWSARWFAQGACKIGKPSLVKSGAISGKCDWRLLDACLFVAGDEAVELRLAKGALGVAENIKPLLSGDRQLLSELGARMLRDLSHELARLVASRAETSGNIAPEEWRAGGLEYVLVLGRNVTFSVRILVPINTVISLRKSLIGSRPKDPVDVVPLQKLLPNQRIELQIVSDVVKVSLSELKELKVGDVLILDDDGHDDVTFNCVTVRNSKKLGVVKIENDRSLHFL